MKGWTASKVCPDVRPDMLGTRGVVVGKKRMLCAIDLSPRSQRAVQRAALLASQIDAQLILLHVMAPDQLAEQAVHVRDQIARQLLSNRLPAVREPTIEVRAGDYVQTIANNAPLTIAAVKRAIIEYHKDPAQRDLALCQKMVEDCFASEDYKEGQTAFMEKRKPVFKGR